jgi:hypothetical protein
MLAHAATSAILPRGGSCALGLGLVERRPVEYLDVHDATIDDIENQHPGHGGSRTTLE